MKLRDLRFSLDKNIYNIAIGEVDYPQSYIQGLHKQIDHLRQKVRQIQQEDNSSKYSSFKQINSIDIGNLDKKSICGRIYRKIDSPSIINRQFSKSKGQSSYYKWKPDIQTTSNYYSQVKNKQKTGRSLITATNTINVAPSYRLSVKTAKQKNKKKTTQISDNIKTFRRSGKDLQIKLEYDNDKEFKKTSKNIHQLENKMDKKIQILQQYNEQKRALKPQQCQQFDMLPPESKQILKYNNIKKKNTKQIKENVNKQKIKQQKIFKRYVQQWQITDINDNFRQKINKKLQVPSNFFLPTIQSQQSLEECQLKIKKAYSLLGVKTQNQKNFIVRKFKNGIFGSLGQDKNIVWYLNGSFYYGCWDASLPTEGQKHGFGFQYIPNKYMYVGNYKYGLKNGKGVLKILSNNENFMYDGQWQNGKMHGFGKQIDESNNKYIGNYQNGQKNGEAVILTMQGLYYEGKVVKGLKQGIGIERLPNGDNYVGEFKNNKFNGIGKYTWSNGSVHEGAFQDGYRQGKGYWKSINGDQFQGQYLKDLKNGYGVYTWANGQVYQGYFKEDLREGQGTYRHPNGKVGKFLWSKGEIVHRVYSQQQQNYRRRSKILDK